MSITWGRVGGKRSEIYSLDSSKNRKRNWRERKKWDSVRIAKECILPCRNRKGEKNGGPRVSISSLIGRYRRGDGGKSVLAGDAHGKRRMKEKA